MLEITSSSNNKCKYVKSPVAEKSRQKYGEYTIEGIKIGIGRIKFRKGDNGTICIGQFF